MITDQDVRKLVGALENQFATKTDLEKFATKTDLEKFATKTDLEKFATKTDLNKMERRMEAKFALKDDILKMEKRFNSKYDKLFTLVDGLAKRVRDIWEELSLTEHRVERMEKSRQRIGV